MPENNPVCQTEVNAVNKIKAGKGQRVKRGVKVLLYGVVRDCIPEEVILEETPERGNMADVAGMWKRIPDRRHSKSKSGR